MRLSGCLRAILNTAVLTKERPSSWFERYQSFAKTLSLWFERVGLAALATIILASVVDAIGTKLFHWPLPGSTEIVGILQVLAIAGGLAISKVAGSQIFIDVLVNILPKRGKAWLEVLSALLGLGLFVIILWQVYLYSVGIWHSGTRTFLLGIPLFPFAFWVALCCIPMLMVLIIDLITSIAKAVK